MILRIVALLVLAVAPTIAQKCNADNCYRQVLGTTRTQSASNVADCQRRLVCTATSTRVTVTTTVYSSPTTTTITFTTPPTSTTVTITTPPSATSTQLVTITTTVTPTTTITVSTFSTFAKRFVTQIAKRQASVCPDSSVPTYASSCGNFARYTSACSCAGVVAGTTTVPNATPTTTLTSTIVRTQTSIITQGVAQSTTTVTSTAPTQTVTSTTTVLTLTSTLTDQTISTTTTTAAAQPTLCGNSGVGWGYWRDYQGSGSVALAQAYDPTAHKLETPETTGVTLFAYINTYDTGDVYGKQVELNDFFVNQRAYLYTTETGTYSFRSAFLTDDLVELWVGPAAYSGWNKNNRNLLATLPDQRDVTYSVFLTGGQYVPFRWILKNSGGPGYAQIIITSPSGRQVFATTSPGYETNEVVQYSCPVVGVVQIAPPFPAFGAET